MTRWEDVYDELYNANDRAQIERLKTRRADTRMPLAVGCAS